MKKISEDLLRILACPKCKSDLDYNQQNQHLDCNSCQISYPIKNGIPIMIVEEAKSLSETKDS